MFDHHREDLEGYQASRRESLQHRFHRYGEQGVAGQEGCSRRGSDSEVFRALCGLYD